MLTYQSKSVADTERLGEIIGSALREGDAVLLQGEMGAGKTALARGVARGAECTVSARSPTFIVVAEYPGHPTIFHCDLYRMSSASEVGELCLEECLERGALLVEWPENGFGALPTDALTIGLAVRENRDERVISMASHGTQADALLARIEDKLSHEIHAS